MLVLLVFAISVLFCFLWVNSFNYWKRLDVPQCNCWLMLLETVLSFIPYRSLAETIQKMYNYFPKDRCYGVYQFGRATLFLRDSELIKQLMVKDFDNFTDHYLLIPEDIEPLMMKNLFALKGDKWRDMRATLSPSFTSSKMKMLFGLISDYSKNFVAYFEEQPGPIHREIKETFTRFTNDVIATSAFGISCDSLRNPDNEFFVMGKEITNAAGVLNNVKILFLVLFPSVAKKMGLNIFSAKHTAFFKNIIKENLEAREKNGVVRPDMLHLLMEARNSRMDSEGSKSQLTDEDITAQALIFFFAGFESIATAMSFMAHELAVNEDIQQRLQKEVDETLSKCDGNITYEALFKMRYMDMVVSEVLRKWPPAMLMDRVCVKPYTIQPSRDGEKPIQLAKGMSVCVPVFGIHRDGNIYPDPDRLDPERFNEDNKSNVDPYTYLPFGIGPRICIGNRFALMEIKLVFFYLLSKFDIVVIDKTVVPLKLARKAFQMTCVGGFWLGLKHRNRT